MGILDALFGGKSKDEKKNEKPTKEGSSKSGPYSKTVDIHKGGGSKGANLHEQEDKNLDDLLKR